MTKANTSNGKTLDWPQEAARLRGKDEPSFAHAGSNLCLDFHGDPQRAGLVVFSDGNHHMALEECVSRFLDANPEAQDVFYATTPPAPLVAALEKGVLHVGNLSISASPHVFIGPAEVLEKLVDNKRMESHLAFAESRGNVLLVRKGNPKGIGGIAEIMGDGITIAISNPESETASFRVYADTLVALADEAGLDSEALKKRLSTGGTKNRVVFSAAIHHREVPELLASGIADVAMIYYHLALRYSRIFADVFDFVPLGGTREVPEPGPAHRITRYHIGLIGDGGDWGRGFAAFMTGAEAQGIYRSHGLRSPV